MGRVKESLPDYVYEGRMDIESFAHKQKIRDLIEIGIFEDKSTLREFLEEVTPIKGKDYFLYAEESKEVYANIRFNREDYINALCCLSQHPLTLYYHLASFDNWITNDRAMAVRCLYVDIDDIGLKADESTKEDSIRFLKDTYNLTDEQMPKWCILSGNGCHLCYPIDEITSKYEKTRELYTQSLVTHFRGDHSGVPISHQFRVPESQNLKDEPIKGKLFKINDTKNKDIHRLDWCLKTEEEISEYRKSYYARRTEKQKATIAKNKQAYKDFMEQLGELSIYDYLNQPGHSDRELKIAQKALRIEKKKAQLRYMEEYISRLEGRIINYSEEDYDLYIYSENSLPYLHLREYDGYKPENRTFNLILDLHHFFIRHKGCLVSREIFFYLLASLFKLKKLPVGDCINWCKKYANYEYMNEMKFIINLTYKSKTKYRYSYKQIANVLCFTDEDIRLSYCNFSDERRANARK